MRYINLPAIIISLLSISLLGYLITHVSPYNGNAVRLEILILFFISLILAISSSLFTILFAYRRWRWEFMPIKEAVMISLRQGVIFALCICTLMSLSLTSTLNILTGMLTIVVCIALELTLS
ncbi:hypothetical protein HGA91_00640 [candidate division WWE3 bacterium]|nr:hypothetical protein [candidate division WWE3 bacterium]